MGLFYRRPLCFFAFLFVAFSLFCFLVSAKVGIIALGILALLLVFCCILGKVTGLFAKKKMLCLTAVISLAVALFSVGYSLLTVALPIRNAERFAGEHAFIAEIVSEEYRSDDYVRYSVNLVQVEEEAVSIPATLSCYSKRVLAPKDRICAVGELNAMPKKDRDGALLSVSLAENTKIYFQPVSEHTSFGRLLLSPSGIRILSERCQSVLRERMITHLGERHGSLAAAFFAGDRSALSSATVRDFTRSGVSHLMAVSGLHFSVLLGALDALLRLLFCPKKGRLAIVTLASVLFLFFAGFAMSACRSAFMLYALYVSFLFREEGDSVTSLFCSFAVIVLISPYAIADLGLWMSFLATLGLLTVYPIISEKIPKSKAKHWAVRRGLTLLRSALMLVLMTVIATLFLLPILWVFFGEISVVSLLANPILSPISYVFLIGIPLWLAVSFVPLLGGAVGALLSWLGEAILLLVSAFSRLPSATVSLNYGFCTVLVPLIAVATVAVLVVRFRHRWLVLLPPAAGILAFCICFAVVQGIERTPRVACIASQGRHEALLISDGDEIAICDASGGAPWLYRELLSEIASSTATEVKSVLLTHYHQGHRASMTLLLQTKIVRTLYLPMPRGAEQRAIATELWRAATDAGSEVVFYEDGILPLTERISAEIFRSESSTFAVAMTLMGENERLTYASSAWLLSQEESVLSEILGQSQTILVGAHEPSDEVRKIKIDSDVTERVIACSKQSSVRLFADGAEHYGATRGAWTWRTEIK